MPNSRFITVAIHTYEKAIALRSLLESENIEVEFRNVNIDHPIVASGVRVRIRESDLPLALRIIENREIFSPAQSMPHRPDDANKPILVPIDFSERSMYAAKVAFHIAARHNTAILLLNTFIDPYVAGNMQLTDSLTYEIADTDTRVKLEKAAKSKMHKFTIRLREMIKSGELPAVKFSTTVVEGVPEDAIAEFTKAHNPFLIVMGTRSSQQKEADLVGSVTAEVLDKCRFSVLVIPDFDTLFPDGVSDKNNGKKWPQKIAFISNIDQDDILALDTLHRYIPTMQTEVVLTRLPQKKRPFERERKSSLEALRKYCQSNFTNFTFDTAELSSSLISDFAKSQHDNGVDLIVVPNKRKNIFSRFFNPSLTTRILFSDDIPMLVIPV